MIRWMAPLVLVTLALAPGAPMAQTSTPSEAPPKKPAAVAPKRFASPELATQAFVTAVRAGDTRALTAILGSSARPLLSSADPVADRQSRETFVRAYDAAHELVTNGNVATLHVGDDRWAFPIPVIKDGDRWRFDARQGREEIVARRIGRNELYTMQTCLAYVDAQREYYAEDRDGNGVLEYARQFASAPGKRDGLYWPTEAGQPPSPLGELVTRARAEGYRRKGEGPTPFHGYIYRILTAQGPAARDGAYDYVTNGHMIAGFALVAFPAEYGVSGVMTFLVNHEGVIYQKDLGPNTRTLARAMRAFNPDGTWTKSQIPELTSVSASPGK